MNQCRECGTQIPPREGWCSEQCFDLYMESTTVTPGHTILDVSPVGNINGGKRSQRKIHDGPLPPSVELPEIDMSDLPF